MAEAGSNKGSGAPKRAASSGGAKPAQRGASAKSSDAKAAGVKSSGAKRATGGKNTKKQGRAKKIGQGILIGILALALILVAGGLIFYERTELPDPNADFGTQTTRLYFRDGTSELGSLSIQNRTVVGYDQMSPAIKDAVVAAEDRSFWTNQGIDLKGIARAVWGIVANREISGGGSTITQQYIKIRYLTSEQTFSRKFRELALALKMDKQLSKEQVLAGYLNTIYFGRGAYGVQAAAKTFFNTTAAELTVHQAAALAALVNQPSLLDPANGEEAVAALTDRTDYVLDGMLEAGTITQEDHDAVYGSLPEFAEQNVADIYGGPNGFLINMAVNELESKGFTAEEIQGGGYQIVTTFDAQMQQAAIDSVTSNTQEAVDNSRGVRDEAGNWVKPSADGLKTGLASIEVGTGAVLALYGGPDFVTSSFNWATTPHYAASTFKVWGAVAGLRNGFSLGSGLRGSTYTPEGDGVPVQNDSGYQYGTVTLQKAIIDSINTAFVDLVGRIPNGTEELVRAATDAGLVENDSWRVQANRMVLGEGEVSPLENATGYATLANQGKRNETHVVAQVIDPAGTVVYTGNTASEQVIEEAVAADLTSALAAAASSSSRNAVGGRAVAGKTGTEGIAVGQQLGEGAGTSATQITRAGWLVGYTPKIATAVMMAAGDSGQENLDVYAKSWQGAFYGAGYPTDIWNDYMAVAVEQTGFETFPPASNIRATAGNAYQAPAQTYSRPRTQAPAPETTEAPESEVTEEAPAPEETQAAPETSEAPEPPVTTQAPPPGQTKEPGGNKPSAPGATTGG